MDDVSFLDGLFGGGILIGGLLIVPMLLGLLPAWILQQRHGYSPWLLVLGLIPYLGAILLLWGMVLSTPGLEEEATDEH